MAVSAYAKPKGFQTWVAKPADVKRDWYIVDAAGLSLGRISQAIAVRLMGKDKPTYTAHVDTGDFVIVINAEQVTVDERKRSAKEYRTYSGYLGGLKKETFESLQARKPEKIIYEAVRRMLPKNTLAAKMLTKLKVYKGAEHPHSAQKPVAWDPLAPLGT